MLQQADQGNETSDPDNKTLAHICMVEDLILRTESAHVMKPEQLNTSSEVYGRLRDLDPPCLVESVKLSFLL